MWSAYFYMGVYKCDVVVVIKIGAYVDSWCSFCVDAYYSNFMNKERSSQG